MANRLSCGREEWIVYPDHAKNRGRMGLFSTWTLREVNWDNQFHHSDTEAINEDCGKHSVYGIAWRLYPKIAEEMCSRLSADHRQIAQEFGIKDNRVLAVLDWSFV